VVTTWGASKRSTSIAERAFGSENPGGGARNLHFPLAERGGMCEHISVRPEMGRL